MDLQALCQEGTSPRAGSVARPARHFRCRHLGACRDVGSETGGSAVRAL